jgi:hypothetical protein
MAIEMHHGQPDNLLLAYLMDTYKKIKPHTSMLLAGVLVLIALLYGYRWLINKGEAQKVETYAAIFEALSSGKTESLEDIADELEGTPEGELARLFAADQHMNEAMMELLTNKQSAALDIDSARQGYETASKSDDPDIRRSALLGLARANETRAATRSEDRYVDESLDTAFAAYEAIVEEFPGSLEAKLAERRIAAIARPSVHEFYKNFANWDQTEEPEDPPTLPPLDLNQLTSGMPIGTDIPSGITTTIPPTLDLSGGNSDEEPEEGTDEETTDPVEPETPDLTNTDAESVEPVVEAPEPVDADASGPVDADATEEETETP